MLITQIFPVIRMRRQFIVPLLLACYGSLFILDGRAFFAQAASSLSSIALWKQLGFSALSAFLFMAVGTLVWLYARNRSVAWLLLCFCSSMMISFVVSPAAKENEPIFSAIGTVSSGYALLAFSLLLLFFPHNLLVREDYRRITRVYVVVLLVGLFASPLYALFEYILALPLPTWVLFSYYGFYLFAMAGILVTIIASYRMATTTRQKHQLRLFVMGVVLAFSPTLLLTVLPYALSLPKQYIVDSQISTISLVLLPLSLGYSILRYEIMLFDSTLRNAASWILGTFGLGLVIYLMILVLGLLGWIFSGTTLIAIILVTFSGLFAWQAMHSFTDHFFFTDQVLYRRAIDHPDVLNADRTNVHTVAHILGGAVARLFDAPHSCLFVLDESSRRYYFVAETTEERRGSVGQQEILCQMKCQMNTEGAAWLDAYHPLLQYLQSMTHPLPLSRALNTGSKQLDGRDQDQVQMIGLTTSDPLIAPIFAQGIMIGIIVASARSDQPYAGPDWEAMHLLQARLAPILETARLYEKAHRRAEMMNALYSSNRSDILPSSEELRSTFAQCAADVFSAGAEFWLYDKHSQELKCCIHQGTGPHFLACDLLVDIERMTLTPWFSSGSTDSSPIPAIPDWVPATAPLPTSFVCLPLECGQHQLGLFVLTFSDFHYFSTEEQRDLIQLASTYAAEIDHASMTTELYHAYERQKELDHLKDEFIITASHELRTPLTSVQGFIELLINYNDSLDEEKRNYFLTIAQHECGELVHQVNMMLEAGKAQTTAKSVRVQPISLIDTLTQVQETLAPTLIEQGRTLELDTPSMLSVLADQMYLRQVLSNLLTNALKYSPHGSPLKIWTEQQDDTLIVHVQDYGAGIPPDAQRHIFERFVRLERDMNSPVRGVGLGLPLCKHLLEAMNGQIWVESTGIVGEGSTFSFSLKIPSEEQTPESAIPSERKEPDEYHSQAASLIHT